MAEDVARALGAGTTDTVTIAGKVCQVRPLSVKELTEVERDCLKRYKRSYIETYTENADLLPEDEAKRLIREKMDEAARWDVSSLPPKFACDPDKIKVTDPLKEWLTEKEITFAQTQDGKPLPPPLLEKRVQRLVAFLLDSDTLSVDEYKKRTGSEPSKLKVGYVNWWITGTYDGMISMVWMAFKESGVTREEVGRELGRNPDMLSYFSREIERISAPEVGNG